jgi:hypothetical protein
MPSTLGLVVSDDPSESVAIRVPGLRAGQARTLNKTITTIPEDRVAMLRVPIQWLCDGQVEQEDDDLYTSTCPDDDEGEQQACIAGECKPVFVASSTLPNFDPELVFGGAKAGAEGGACFPTEDCFDRGFEVVPETDCSVNLPLTDDETPSFALVTESDGMCSAASDTCYVPLDQSEDFGWYEDIEANGEGRRFVLPAAVCARLDDGVALALWATRACETKTPALPPCGPWCSVEDDGTALVHDGVEGPPDGFSDAGGAGGGAGAGTSAGAGGTGDSEPGAGGAGGVPGAGGTPVFVPGTCAEGQTEALLEPARDREHDVLFVGAAAADRARILATMARVDRNGDPPRRRSGACAFRRRAALRFASRHRVRWDAGLAWGHRVRHCDWRLASFALEERHQRIDDRERIEVDDEAMTELRDRLQREHLRPHLDLEIEHDAQESTRGTADTYRRDVRIARLHARRQLVELARALDACEIEHQPVGVAQQDHLMLDRRGGLEDDARVLFGGPQSRRRDARCVGPCRGRDPVRGGKQQPAKRPAA